MEYLKDYITERIRVGNLRNTEFPLYQPIVKIAGFLKSLGFEEIIIKGKTLAIEVIPVCTGKLVFAHDGTGNGWIRFADLRNEPISWENPIFYYYSHPDHNDTFAVEISSGIYKTLKANEFIKLINKTFGFTNEPIK